MPQNALINVTLTKTKCLIVYDKKKNLYMVSLKTYL